MEMEIKYKKCNQCKAQNTFMCDEYASGEYFNFCIRCGFSEKNIDKVKSEVSLGEGTLRYALKEGTEGFQVGPLALKDIVEFTKWVKDNQSKIDYAHITFCYSVKSDKKDVTKWMFHNLITNKQSDYEIEKDYLFGKDFKQDQSRNKKKKKAKKTN